MSFKIDYPSSSLSRGLENMQNKIGIAVKMYAITKASELEAKMKLQRPWTDRTGLAKSTLNAQVSQPNPNLIRITLAHGVDYGIWLELAHEKNWAIIGPIITQESPNVVNDMNNLMNFLLKYFLI